MLVKRRLVAGLAALSLSAIGSLVPASASALEWGPLWLNDNQRGAKKMEDGQYAPAAETFTDPRWKAAALYRAGEYQDAAEAWQPLDDADAHYNRGNAHARAGDLQAAVDAYETALERDPGHQDAGYNLELLKNLMQDSNDPESSDEQTQQDPGRQEQESKQSEQDQSGGPQSEQRNQQSGETDSSQRDSERMNEQPRREQQPADASDREAQQAGQPESSDLSESEQKQASQRLDELHDTDVPERQAAMEQWLRRIPDDPGGLLRRKFLYQYSNRHRRKERVEEPW